MSKRTYLKQALIASGLILASSQAFSAGFQISEATVSGLGRAFAGAGVAGDDVSDMFYNPAGMFLAEGRQFQIGLSVLNNEFKFKGTGTPFGGPGDDGGTTEAVPNLYYVFPENGKFKYGVSVTAPFGLTTEYNNDWAGRYQALKTSLTTIDINPALAYQVNDMVSIGGGVIIEYADAELSQARLLGAGMPDGKSKVDGDNWELGYNLGIMFAPSDATRFGLGYRSKIKQTLDGNLKVTAPNGATLVSSGAEATVTLPETVYLSAFHSLNEKVDLMASARYTNWSRFEELRIKFDNGLPDSVTPENWDDTWTLSIGGAYHLNNQWTLRAGYAHDESPVSEEYRTARIPDSDREWLTLGASFAANQNMTIDFGYAHVFADDAPINETTVLAGPPTSPTVVSGNLSGKYTGGSDILGVQLQWKF